jgi:hypothetical protein
MERLLLIQNELGYIVRVPVKTLLIDTDFGWARDGWNGEMKG